MGDHCIIGYNSTILAHGDRLHTRHSIDRIAQRRPSRWERFRIITTGLFTTGLFTISMYQSPSDPTSASPTSHSPAPGRVARPSGPVWLAERVRLLQWMVGVPQLLALIVVIDIAAYFAGLIFWYGYVMTDPATPWWLWPFIPDCPLFGLLGGLGLLMVVARQQWPEPAQQQAQRTLWIAAAVSLIVCVSTFLPVTGAGWMQQRAMFALWTVALLVGALAWRRPPIWLLGLFAFGQIKYGIWTITAWLLYWRSTADLWGAPHFSPDSVLMTVVHIGLAAQGVLLLTYFRPDWRAAAAGLIWFGASDFVDYGLGFYPAIPEQLVSLSFMQWSTTGVTLLLSALFALWAWRGRFALRTEPVSHAPSSV